MRMAVRNITLKQLRSSLTGNAKTPIKIAERPTPYPGRKWPTRVAWEFEIRTATEGLRDRVAELVERRRRLTGRAVVEIMRDADVQGLMRQRPVRRLRYV